MLNNTIAYLAILLAATFLSSCASAIERQAFADLAELERTPFAAGRETDAKSPLQELNADSTLSDYLAYAALNNPGLEAAFNKWKAALHKVPQARSLPDPMLSYAYQIRNVETKVGPQRDKVGLMQVFPWFGKLDVKARVALEAAQSIRHRYEAEKLNLFNRVKKAYYEYYYLSRAIGITEENVALLKRLEGVVRTRYTAGAAPHSSLIKVQVALAKLEDRLETLRALRGPHAAKLNTALNRPAEKTIPWPKALPREKMEASDDELFRLLGEKNPELKAIDAMAEKEKLAIELATKNRYPNFSLGAQYVHTRNPHGTSRPVDSGKDPWVGMISLNIPIWTEK
jgi:outer membrane protein TolC